MEALEPLTLNVPPGWSKEAVAKELAAYLLGVSAHDNGIRLSLVEDDYRPHGPWIKQKGSDDHWQLDGSNDYWLHFDSDRAARLNVRYAQSPEGTKLRERLVAEAMVALFNAKHVRP